jgi:hypothetical protein
MTEQTVSALEPLDLFHSFFAFGVAVEEDGHDPAGELAREASGFFGLLAADAV